MAFRAATFTQNSTANWPTTSTGDDVYAFVSFDDNPGSVISAVTTGWTIVGATQSCTFDGQVSALFHYTGNGGAGAPSSPPTTAVFSSNGGGSDPSIVIWAHSGRTIGSLTFNAITVDNTGRSTPFTNALTGGTTAAGDDLVVVMALDQNPPNTGLPTLAVTDAHGDSFTTRGVGFETWSTIGLATADNVGGAATGTVSTAWAQGASSAFTYGSMAWVFSIAAAGGGGPASDGAYADPPVRAEAAPTLRPVNDQPIWTATAPFVASSHWGAGFDAGPARGGSKVARPANEPPPPHRSLRRVLAGGDEPARRSPSPSRRLRADAWTLSAVAQVVALATFLAPDAAASSPAWRAAQPTNDLLGAPLATPLHTFLAADDAQRRPQADPPPKLPADALGALAFGRSTDWGNDPPRTSAAIRPVTNDPALAPTVPPPSVWAPWDPVPSRGEAPARPPLADVAPGALSFGRAVDWTNDPARARGAPRSPDNAPTLGALAITPAPTSWVPWDAPPARGAWGARQPINASDPLDGTTPPPATKWVAWDALPARGASLSRRPVNEATPWNARIVPPLAPWWPESGPAGRQQATGRPPADVAPLARLAFGGPFLAQDDGPVRPALARSAVPADFVGAPLARPLASFLDGDGVAVGRSMRATVAAPELLASAIVIHLAPWAPLDGPPARGLQPPPWSPGNEPFFLDASAVVPVRGPLFLAAVDAQLLRLHPVDAELLSLHPFEVKR